MIKIITNSLLKNSYVLADKVAEDSEVSFMNTIQAQSVLPSGNVGKVIDIALSKPEFAHIKDDTNVAKSDVYSATTAKDSFVARVLTSSIGKTLGHVSHQTETRAEKSSVSEKYASQISDEKPSINIETVTKNVVGFVETAISKLAKTGVESTKLQYFIDEAAKGVDVGVDQAKLALISVANDDLFSMIDSTRDSILNGLKDLSTDPNTYIKNSTENAEIGNSPYYSSIVSVQDFDKNNIEIDLSPKSFDMPKDDENKSFYTSNSSNLSFTISGSSNDASRQKVADLINNLDSLANSFYRGDIESAYQKSIDIGYSNLELTSLAKQVSHPERFAQVKTYGDIQHINTNALAEEEAPKAVAEYINRYLGIIEASKESLQSEQDFNEVINGLVNQMKDVQVPDLLHAINRFHAFNNKFK